MASAEELADEATRARKVRQIVDIATNLLLQSGLTRQEAEHLVRGVRHRILTLFPDGGETYELCYAPRFRRLIDEFASDRPQPRGVVIPFSRPRH